MSSDDNISSQSDSDPESPRKFVSVKHASDGISSQSNSDPKNPGKSVSVKLASDDISSQSDSKSHRQMFLGEIKEAYKTCSETMSMYGLPKAIRNLRKSAYTPRLVSIGPIHSHKSHVQPMQAIKMNYVYSLLDRLSKWVYKGRRESEDDPQEIALGDCLDQMKDELDDAKKHYASDVRGKLDEMMLVIDGCFILELLYEYYCLKTVESTRINIELPQEPVPTDTPAPKRCGREWVEPMVSMAKRFVGWVGLFGKWIACLVNPPKAACAREWVPEAEAEFGVPERGGVEPRVPKREFQDPIFGSGTLTRHTVLNDLLLLENQLPFSVLHNLYENTLKKIQEADERFHIPQLRELVIQCFGDLLSPEQKGNQTPPAKADERFHIPHHRELVIQCFGDLLSPEQKGNQTPPAAGEGPEGAGGNKEEQKDEHILQLLHRHFCHLDEQCQPPGETNKKDDDPLKITHTEFAYSAWDLDNAGVKFLATNTTDFPWKEDLFIEPTGYFQWFVKRATFEIPTLCIIDDSTDLLFRNLIAFEQCTSGVPRYFTSYAFLLDKLINTEKDVQVLQKAGVIRHYLGSNEEVSELVNKLCSEVILGNFLFQKACDDVDRYRKKWWPNFRAQLMRNYFSTPWTFVAFCLAFLTFGIQITSFVRSFSG